MAGRKWRYKTLFNESNTRVLWSKASIDEINVYSDNKKYQAHSNDLINKYKMYFLKAYLINKL